MLKKALIIQGPIISRGRTGSPFQSHVSFSCIKNINRLNKQFISFFDNIVFVCWESDKKFIKEINVKKIIFIKDIPAKNLISSNKFRQFESTLKGLNYLESLGYNDNDIVFKIRTDQFLDLEMTNKIEFKEQLYVPYIHGKNNGSPYPIVHLVDLYLAGKMKLLKNFLIANNRNAVEFTDSVHIDAFYRFAFIKYPNETDRIIFFTSTSHIYENNKKLVYKVYNNWISPLPKEMYESMIWRGVPIFEKNIKDFIFYHDWESNFKKSYLDSIISRKPRLNFFNKFYIIGLDKFYINEYTNSSVYKKINLSLFKNKHVKFLSKNLFRAQRRIISFFKLFCIF